MARSAYSSPAAIPEIVPSTSPALLVRSPAKPLPTPTFPNLIAPSNARWRVTAQISLGNSGAMSFASTGPRSIRNYASFRPPLLPNVPRFLKELFQELKVKTESRKEKTDRSLRLLPLRHRILPAQPRQRLLRRYKIRLL